jgi:RNA polymerase sigma-70 factor (ECF subfamily)
MTLRQTPPPWLSADAHDGPSVEPLAPAAPAGLEAVSSGAAADAVRLRGIVDRHYDFLWRTLRYLGVPAAALDDAAQQALWVLARRLGEIAPGAEMSFLFATAVRIAAEARRAASRQRSSPVEDVDAFTAGEKGADELLDERRAHEALREMLDAIPVDLRVVFVLFEIEELTIAEVAEMVGIPAGTVASRLRRAREKFRALVRRRRLAQRDRAAGGRP